MLARVVSREEDRPTQTESEAFLHSLRPRSTMVKDRIRLRANRSARSILSRLGGGGCVPPTDSREGATLRQLPAVLRADRGLLRVRRWRHGSPRVRESLLPRGRCGRSVPRCAPPSEQLVALDRGIDRPTVRCNAVTTLLGRGESSSCQEERWRRIHRPAREDRLGSSRSGAVALPQRLPWGGAETLRGRRNDPPREGCAGR